MSSLAPSWVWQGETAVLSRSRGWLLVGAAGLVWVAVWVISLSRNLFDPIGFDQAFWQYALERVQAGGRMYVDVWDQNAPGILGVHWLATLLVGRSPLDLRIFDGGWQLVTMAALALLVIREGRSPATGLLAATLYALAYYAGGYVHTAQRDGFAVLPMLLAMHVASTSAARGAVGSRIGLHLLAGVLCFLAFILKPPLGVILVVIGFFALRDTRRARFHQHQAPASGSWRPGHLLALMGGFMVAASITALLLMRWGWWDGFLRAMSREDVPGYILGPRLLRSLVPSAACALGLWTICCIGLTAGICSRGWGRIVWRNMAAGWLAGAAVLLLLLSLWAWDGWREVSPYVLGLMIPALASGMRCPAEGRSRTWRLAAMMAVATGAAIVLQGQFFLYHFWPLVACLAYLSAAELADQTSVLRQALRSRTANQGQQAYWALCCCAVLALASHAWYQKMTCHSRAPYVLSRMSLAQYYDTVTKHKPRYPLYSTSCRAAASIRAWTTPNEAIACLVNEPRIYYLAERPAAHKLVIVNPAFRPMFAGFIQTLVENPPRVLVARVPVAARGPTACDLVHRAVFDDAVCVFGAQVEHLRTRYKVEEVIDDICLLKFSAGEAGASVR